MNGLSREQITFSEVISGAQENLLWILSKKPSIGFYPEPAHSNLHPQSALLSTPTETRLSYLHACNLPLPGYSLALNSTL
jgi:hypothetical protein